MYFLFMILKIYRRFILLGDDHQLPPLVVSREAQQKGKLYFARNYFTLTKVDLNLP